MNRLLIGGAAAALVVAIAPLVAQPAPPPPPGVASGTAPAPIAPAAPRMHMMMMSNKTITRDEVVSHIRDMFARLDTNRDGYLTREEVDAIRTKMMGMRGDVETRLAEHGIQPRDRGAMFDRLDTNHDGSISRREYMAARPQVHERRVMVMREGGAPGEPGMKGMHAHGMGMGMHFGGRLFDMADSNKDGRVSLAEAQAAALAHFDRADLNHDGRITPEERQQAHQLMGAQRRPG
jgi:hypothetical protein